MIIHIEAESDIPIYTQLTNQIIEGIARGEIAPGDSLPSVRAFAADLGVNMHTVNKSYHELEKKGIIKIVPKSGAIISSIEQMTEEKKQLIEAGFKPVIAEAFVLGMSKKEIEELVSGMLNQMKER
ncbi:GntR family transcriptional regulator [Ureibacillus chungkukjangi]|uniref:GntR family transcriptional regulator n=1 Tax=Ureibacillus chungkukjangi TaxID=1202712 RepID=A0A318TPK3_9BACL|nr:GntR family transcriptional regulator [Ureibacillus chungkukjangi]MCM3388512.1 GntR family transcriptional regulator [Ureibacillus chungkukjangi]PYF05827.1 GntR family transcriptional regulator [Ureibacillus chungkukjangi]